MKKILSLLLGCSLLLSVTACNETPQGKVPYEDSVSARVAAEIRKEQRDAVAFPSEKDESFTLTGVTENESSSHVANKKFELDLGVVADGNVYDPNEVDVYGQFLSPSGKLYTMPAFYYESYQRSFVPLDESAKYAMTGYVEQGDVTLHGVIDEKEGVKQPVGYAEFASAAGVYSNVGAILNTADVGNNLDSISVWLRKDATLVADALYLCLYQSDGEAYIRLPALTEEWAQYTFAWSDFTANNVDGSSELLPIRSMYSGYVQTRGSAASGGLYISDMRAVRAGFVQNAQLASFIAPELQKYKAGELNGTEVVTATGNNTFKLRFRFDETGEWLYRVMVEDGNTLKAKYTSAVTVTENANEEENRGIIRVEQTQKRNFMFEDGTPYVPHGFNLCYSVDAQRGSYDYDVYFPRMKAAGMNFSRVWLTYIGHGIQSTEGGILGFGERQDKAYIFDVVLDMAEEYGLYLQVPLMTFSRFFKESATDDVEWRSWDSSPYNVINGGYLETPEDFYTDARAKEDTKKLYRYYVARYGYSRNILNWEIMNEIGESSDYNEDNAKAWAEEIGDYMHAIDPYNHLVSLSSVKFFDKVYSASSLDFTSIHSYIWNNEYANASADVTLEVQKYFNKPVIIGETGASSVSEDYNLLLDPTGLVMRQMAFTAPMAGSAGGGMLFWWQQINNLNFYGHLTPAIEFFKLLPKNFISMESIDKEDYAFQASKYADKGRVLGFHSETAAYAYLYDTRYNYAVPTPPTFAQSSVDFLGMQDGEYTVRVFDTQTGKVVKTTTASAQGGKVTVTLDDWNCDVALLVEKK